MQDGLYFRLKTKALGNQLAIAVGSSRSDEKYSIPALAEEINRTFNLNFTVEYPDLFFDKWNELIKEAEKVVKRPDLIKFVRERVQDAAPTTFHRKVAAIPISNFIDTTFDRSLYKALVAAGRKPILHDWRREQAMGIWKQSNPEEPNVFFMLPPVDDDTSSWGVYEQTGRNIQSGGNNYIQIENVTDMLSDKDLVLLDYTAQEAESVLHLHYLHLTTGKIVNYTLSNENFEYWPHRGVIIRNLEPETLIDKLLPYEGGQYTGWDGFIAGKKIVDFIREKPYDCFISYFSGDKEFVRRVEQELRFREVELWLDEYEIEVGDSISSKIERGLAQSYTLMIVLSPEALSSAWVKEELRAAYSLRLAGELKILPVLHKECDIPPFLADYKYADFRDEKRYHEQISLLERSIKNAVKKAREKQ
jgi:hypothetical protein